VVSFIDVPLQRLERGVGGRQRFDQLVRFVLRAPQLPPGIVGAKRAMPAGRDVLIVLPARPDPALVLGLELLRLALQLGAPALLVLGIVLRVRRLRGRLGLLRLDLCVHIVGRE
jgi:hypothetical protein